MRGPARSDKPEVRPTRSRARRRQGAAVCRPGGGAAGPLEMVGLREQELVTDRAIPNGWLRFPSPGSRRLDQEAELSHPRLYPERDGLSRLIRSLRRSWSWVSVTATSRIVSSFSNQQ